MTSLPASWIPASKRLDHPERKRMRLSPARIKWCAAGRRSGKSLDGLDYLLIGHGPRKGNRPRFSGALNPPPHVLDPTYVVAAPTREMVKRLWWGRIKQRLPDDWIDDKNEQLLTLNLANGSRIICLGMDRPTRGEGFAIDGLVGDEFAYWKPEGFESSLGPSLSTRGRAPGWAILMGKPQGRNHFYDGWLKAREGRVEGHDAFLWHSSVILDPKEIAAARARMSKRAFEQEYEASFLTQTGLVYDAWDAALHVRPVAYNPGLPLIFSLDFNVSPGSAVVMQEQFLPPPNNVSGAPIETTCVLDEVHEPDNSRTQWVCSRLAAKFPNHKGPVQIYGDSAGHQRRTSARQTDWEIVREELSKVYGSQVQLCVGRAAPSIIDSVNALNSRLLTSDGTVGIALDPRCLETRRDFEGVVWDDRKSDRDIDKRNLKRTHWCDSIRYYAADRFALGQFSATY